MDEIFSGWTSAESRLAYDGGSQTAYLIKLKEQHGDNPVAYANAAIDRFMDIKKKCHDENNLRYDAKIKGYDVKEINAAWNCTNDTEFETIDFHTDDCRFTKPEDAHKYRGYFWITKKNRIRIENLFRVIGNTIIAHPECFSDYLISRDVLNSKIAEDLGLWISFKSGNQVNDRNKKRFLKEALKNSTCSIIESKLVKLLPRESQCDM